jgi:hypothetical protein
MAREMKKSHARIFLSVLALFVGHVRGSANGGGEAMAPAPVIAPPAELGQDARFASFAAHPRLLLTPAVADRIRGLRDSDPLMAALLQSVKAHADLALTQPLPGGDMKEKRRHSMFRVLNMGMMYRLDGDPAYANRIRDYLLDAVTWKDWGGQWLNTGEMGAWTAIGYDWIHDHLSPADRDRIRDGIVDIAIHRGLSAHAAGKEHWLKSADNWNQVCNGGLVLAALATAEHAVPGARQQEINDKAQTTVRNALRSYGFVLPAYAPDGDWFEGPTYYAYGATYQAVALQALQDAYGDLRGLDSLAGFDAFDRSGEHFIQAVGPTGLYFNHGDAKPRCYFTPLMFWLARHAQRPDFATWERRQLTRDLGRMSQTAPILMMAEDTLDRFHALSALWYVPADGSGDERTPPKAQHFRGLAASGAMRTGWNTDSVYLGFKGGFPDADHAHMDCGSFVLDAGGLRWATDLGFEGASALPDYYGNKRWNYYHATNHAHNTLVINGALQRVKGKAAVTDFGPVPGGHRAIVNLSDAYENASVHRGFLLMDDGRVIIEDRVTTTSPNLPVRWGMATPASITLVSPGIAMLHQEGLHLRARVLAPAGADFHILSTNPYELNPDAPAKQNTNPGTRMLGIATTSPAAGELEITVLLEPVGDEQAEPAPPPLPRPVRDWRRDAP